MTKVIPRLVLLILPLWVGLAFGADLPIYSKKSLGDDKIHKIHKMLLPDPITTPGKADPALTAEVLCSRKFTTRDVRSVTAAMKRDVYARYSMVNHKAACGRSRRGCEIDHDISLELGGANDIENLWPQPFGKPWGAEIKDKLENRLHKLVCAGELDLAEAQQCISTDWIACYKAHMPTVPHGR